MLTAHTGKKDHLILFKDINRGFGEAYTRKLVPRVISLIDMDAFFAQVCHIKYNIPRDKPLAVIHGNLVLALNYPSKEKGLSRGMSKEQITAICPEVIIPKNIFVDPMYTDKRVAQEDDSELISYLAYTSGENPDAIKIGKSKDSNAYASVSSEDEMLQYNADLENASKVSLDMFRQASRLVFESLTSYLPSCKSQIASIDEIYFDLTELVVKVFDVYLEIINESDCKACIDKISDLGIHLCANSDFGVDECEIEELKTRKELIRYMEILFPELFDKSEFSAVVYGLYDYNIGKTGNEEEACGGSGYFGIIDLTFEEMCLIIGSVVIYRARRRLLNETTYTCSSGIYVNKLYSKMLSSLRKPNGQVVLLPRWFEKYISETSVLKLRFLGGKLGNKLTQAFPRVTSIMDLQKYDIQHLIDLFGRKNGTYLYNSSRGIDNDPVVSKREISSMQSSKIFGIPLNTSVQLERWLWVFSNELYYRNFTNYKQYKSKPTKIGLKTRDSDGTVKTKTSSFKYKSDIPTVDDIYEHSRHILYVKLGESGANTLPRNVKRTSNHLGSALLPCKYLGVSLSGFVKIINNEKISFKVGNGRSSDFKQSSVQDAREDNGGNLDVDYTDEDLILMRELESQMTQDDHFVSDEPVLVNSSRTSRVYSNWPFEYPNTNKRKHSFKANRRQTGLSMEGLLCSRKKRDTEMGENYIQTKLSF